MQWSLQCLYEASAAFWQLLLFFFVSSFSKFRKSCNFISTKQLIHPGQWDGCTPYDRTEMFMSFLMHAMWNSVNYCTFPSTLNLTTLHNEAIHNALTLSGWTIRGTVFPDTQSVLILRNVWRSNDLYDTWHLPDASFSVWVMSRTWNCTQSVLNCNHLVLYLWIL